MGESWGGDKADEHFCCVSFRSHTPVERSVMYTTTGRYLLGPVVQFNFLLIVVTPYIVPLRW